VVEIEAAVEQQAVDSEAANLTNDIIEVHDQGLDVNSGNEIVMIQEGGVRVSQDSEEEDGQGAEKKSRRKKSTQGFNSREAKYLSLFVSGHQCRRKIWDDFFGNDKKRMSVLPPFRLCIVTSTLYRTTDLST
jgi:hypothetical protein